MCRRAVIPAAVAALAFAAPAAATAPQTDVFTRPAGEAGVIGDCDGAPIAARFGVTIRRTLFFEAIGQVVRVRRRIALDGTLTNLDAGTTVAVRGMRVLAETGGEFRATGSGVHFVGPGLGTVAIEAGIERETADHYLEHGRRNPFTDKLCATLAPS